MAHIERHRSPRQAAKALIVAGAVGALALAGISGALAQRDDLYDDSPSNASGIFGDDFPSGAVFPSGVFGDDHASDVLTAAATSMSAEARAAPSWLAVTAAAVSVSVAAPG